MQTFVPYPDMRRSAEALDDRRLGKQRVEAMQILRALTYEKYGWKHHPAVLMWKGHEEALGAYAAAICAEWCRRGFADSCDATIRIDLANAGITKVRTERQLAKAKQLPPWWGDDQVHASHRRALLRKDPRHYAAHFPDEPSPPGAEHDDYVWPVRSTPTSR
ncbi:MAG TPA: MSMEG_6728 family protein [Acidimicrobiales bacterium]|nr:MSMEG_6728 family protein [Acidimicrobiales bacterium]